jgi:hypothetical protein
MRPLSNHNLFGKKGFDVVVCIIKPTPERIVLTSQKKKTKGWLVGAAAGEI